MLKKFGFWVSMFFLALAIASLVMYFTRKDMTVHANDVIEQVSDSFKTDLKSFLYEIDRTASHIKNDTTKKDVDEISNDELKTYYSSLIEREKYLMGIVVLGQEKNFVMINDNNSWIITHNRLTDSLIDWSRLDKKLTRTGGWTEAYNEFMNSDNFGAVRIGDLVEGNYVWRSSQSEIPERRNLMFTAFRTNAEVFDIVALIYRTGDLGARFSKVLDFDNPLVSIITDDYNLVTPMHTSDTAKIHSYENLTTKIEELVKVWSELEIKQPNSYNFNYSTVEYWSRIDTVNMNMGILGFALTIPDRDLKNVSKKVKQAFLYAAIMFLLFALFAYLTSSNKLNRSTGQAKNNISPMEGDQILEMIRKGESELVEFKSSLRWDYREEKVNRILEDVILKSISAFSNAKGGTLFIGVNDDMELIGLEPDFKTLKKQDVDYFELHLRKLINNQYGIRFSNKHILMQFPELEGRIICVIHIASGDTPVYLKTKNKQGHEVEKFFVRSGNASQEITSLKEINEYVASHFKVKS